MQLDVLLLEGRREDTKWCGGWVMSGSGWGWGWSRRVRVMVTGLVGWNHHPTPAATAAVVRQQQDCLLIAGGYEEEAEESPAGAGRSPFIHSSDQSIRRALRPANKLRIILSFPAAAAAHLFQKQKQQQQNRVLSSRSVEIGLVVCALNGDDASVRR
uniref:Uncharacterized protein n=1 Tax=Globodera rostochiensis TaxID=31243 RepID=A0A914HHN7_GLORO